MSNQRQKQSQRKPAEPKATGTDAQVILHLYELRGETEMRKARHFISANFWPQTAEDTLRIARAYPSQENTWLRQVTSYWEMAASLVLRGALHESLFFDSSGEMYCVFAKFKPCLAEIRNKLPYFLLNVERVVMSTEEGRSRLQRLEARLARRQQKLGQRRSELVATSAGYS